MKHPYLHAVVFFSTLMLALLPALVVGAAEERPAKNACAGLLFSSVEEPGETVEFDALITVDLMVTLVFPDTIEGEHVLELSFFQPGGQLYQSMAFLRP